MTDTFEADKTIDMIHEAMQGQVLTGGQEPANQKLRRRWAEGCIQGKQELSHHTATDRHSTDQCQLSPSILDSTLFSDLIMSVMSEV